MYIVLVGGGKVGYYLAKTLIQAKHRVGIIESDSNRCKSIANDLDALVINGDGTDIAFLEEANASEAAYVAAVTGKDEENLVACQLAKKYFEVPRTIARVNNPKNQGIFTKLGVDTTVSSTGTIARLIQNELAETDLKTLPLFENTNIEMIQVELKKNSPVAGRLIRELKLPAECVFIALLRQSSVLIPKGDTLLHPGDRIFALCHIDSHEILKKILLGA
jgi:trk system potassium uptake protein TrkA